MKRPRNINNLNALNKEIYRLQLHARMLEKKIDEKFDHFQNNYSSMIVKSFLPAIAQKSGIAGNLLQFVFQNQRLQDSISKLAERLFNKVSDGVEFIADKLDSQKKENT